MAEKDILLIANPTAGAGAGRINKQRLVEVAVRDLERGGRTVEVALEATREAVEAQAERGARDGYAVVVAAGGDGTINAVVNGMMRAAEENIALPLLGILPMGTGNVFAFNMDIDRSWREACRVIRKGNTRNIDVGLARSVEDEAHHQYFMLMAGIGFDAKVVEDTSLRLKYVLREFAYVLHCLQNVVLHQGTKVTLKFEEGKSYTGQSWLVMVGNAASYAWDIKVTQRAQLDDGNVDVCFMPWHNKLVSVQQAMQILTGQHVERGIARYWKTKGVVIESEPPIPVQLDGDEWGRTPLKITVLPGALRVLAPPTERPLVPGK